ncbi:class I SAM-dependent methyltransferase [Viridibacillus arvi]|uniref:Methyltransferase domain-containing protein n=1 Tax=Viridibacillus arvi TaxID=263475 RepID=A0A0M0LEW8_9BACL|nr:class I SAM-dependent methyltransferase [Viridibacillus arvi]KOO49599.1 hypothetical protein AMD00_14755 [Viridibacillus arvi]
MGKIIEFTGEKENQTYWNQFYKTVKIDGESTFCSFVKTYINNEYIVVDIGCGSGRDTKAFAMNGIEVFGIDQSEEAIETNTLLSESEELINFIKVDVSNFAELNSFFEGIKEKRSNKKLLIYSRFFVHSIEESTQKNLMKVLESSLLGGDYVALEFRTKEDEELHKIFDNHYRRYIDSEKFVEEITNEYTFMEIYYYKGRGLSVFKDEDPYLARIIFEKK